eukprot:1195221-Prorocentrum_minimum.AAC.8
MWTDVDQVPESTAKKAFDFSSIVDSRRLSTLTATWLVDSRLRGLKWTDGDRYVPAGPPRLEMLAEGENPPPPPRVTAEHFALALRSVAPSVSKADARRYEELRKKLRCSRCESKQYSPGT